MNRENCINIFERYISGKASPLEIMQLNLFLEDDANLNEWLENQILNSSDIINSNVEIRMLENIRSRTNYHSPTVVAKNKNIRSHLRWISNISAVLFPFAIILGAYLYLKPQRVESFEVIANMGEKASLTLSEGSKIALNSDSKITYFSDFNLKKRNIQLNGEAYFDVSHNPEKPFIVECKDIKIKVLGTSFGIKAYEDEGNIWIVLNSGKIQLITPKEEIEMSPNDYVVYNIKTQSTSREKVNAEDYTNWRQNRLRFENESLEIIMKTISRTHNIDIVFENPNLKNQHFTGTVDNTNIESVLNAIKLTSQINYRLKNGTVYLYDNN